MATTGPDTGFRTDSRLRHRKNVDRLSSDQVRWFREGIAGMAEITRDERGLSYWASVHGGPPRSWCHHGTFDGVEVFRGAPLFLPWHRAYLFLFELALQDQQPRARVPWWNWSSEAARREGLPAAFAQERVGGEVNPLVSQPVLRGPGRERLPERTRRRPSAPRSLPPQREVERVLRLNNFTDFSTQLEQIHGAIHGWVGGTMSAVPTAAYDPIFWAHHSMVDRLWRIWQLRNPESTALVDVRDRPLAPFELTVGDVLDVTELGYDYASTTTSVDVDR